MVIPTNFKLLYSANEIYNKIYALSKQLNRDYLNKDDVCFIGVLNGAVFFLTDLMLQLDFAAGVDFIRASSYGLNTETSGNVILSNIDHLNLNNKHIIIVDDIVDTGLTLHKIKNTLQYNYNPRSIKTCVLIKKYGRERISVEIDYYCFELGNEFVVGFGLDNNNQYRNLRDIYII